MSKTPVHNHLLSCDEMLTLDMRVSELLEALEDDLGPEAVWKLTGTYGGCVLHLPKRNAMQRSVVFERLGETIFTWLHNRLGHGTTQIPMGPHSRSARNMAAFRAAFLKNKSHPQIARELNCHARTVERVAARLRDAGFL
ncbi:hypothetical protein GTA62_15275 [Roseobacter sp. HKCCD9010]|uniref:hypothetical protein n=1 Tax=unclassified Roseobacter TaxID=196798 RepID=UPI001491DEE2|nr:MULTISPECIES: hypothetical protein [unclassified Roseobacter]MBF9050532.1 hypothetical protein [Rhodobacterales bacterium HKCCD4356]NNV12051.1 hypothetical protein [Roseobacter sp. HKCCD7357]NNV17065.1 hypothetical protein [Roseobacter sp. HKCCD8768]NNV26294.1 hypothetical protein [Roseobacter sp. HKCCD8192]NNV30789.1 hypothetical protein [Roseobacter sp. HKCCD9061]